MFWSGAQDSFQKSVRWLEKLNSFAIVCLRSVLLLAFSQASHSVTRGHCRVLGTQHGVFYRPSHTFMLQIFLTSERAQSLLTALLIRSGHAWWYSFWWTQIKLISSLIMGVISPSYSQALSTLKGRGLYSAYIPESGNLGVYLRILPSTVILNT